MNLFGMVQIGASTVIFLLAATMAKQWALAPSLAKILITLALYTIGNLIMLKLIRDFGGEVAKRIPARRIGVDEDMAGAAIYLASRAGDYVVGETLTVDGGIVNASLSGSIDA